MELTPDTKIEDIKNLFLTKCSFFTPNKRTNANGDMPIKDANVLFSIFIEKVDKIVDMYKGLVSDYSFDDKKASDNLNRIIFESGMLLESIGYLNIYKTSLMADTEFDINSSDTLCKNDVALDGRMNKNTFFDIKSFLLFSQNIHKKINELSNKYINYLFALSRSTDVNAECFWNKAVDDEIQSKTATNRAFLVQLPNGGILEAKIKEQVNIVESSFNPFKWIQCNYEFVLRHASQFTTNAPFIQIEIIDLESFHCIDGSVYFLLRTMARRAFFQLKNSDKLVSDYCSKIHDSTLVKNAITYLSALWFMDYKTGESFVFINPFAKFKVNRLLFERYQWDC